MSFTLRVWFSGLCQFVTNSALGDEKSFDELSVLLPDARKGPVPHAASVSIPKRVPVPSVDGKFKLEFDDDAAALLHEFRAPERMELDLEFEPETDLSLTYFDFLPDRMIDLKELAGSYSDRNAEAVSEKAVEGVLAQVVFRRGLSGIEEGAAVQSTWFLPDTLLDGRGDYRYIEVAEPRFLDIPGLKRAALVFTDLASGKRTPLPLEPPTPDFMEILVSNRCQEARIVGEVRKAAGENRFQVVQMDDDFVFHYDVLHPTTRQSLSQHVSQTEGENLPVPERVLLELWLNQEVFGAVLPDFQTKPFCVRLDGLVPTFCPTSGGDGGTAPPDEIWNPSAWFPLLSDRQKEALRRFLEFITTAVATGSGCDCLPCRGESRFLDGPTGTGSGTGSALQAAPSDFPTLVADLDPASGRRTVRKLLARVEAPPGGPANPAPIQASPTPVVAVPPRLVQQPQPSKSKTPIAEGRK